MEIYPKHAVIYYENDSANEIFFIQKGEIELYKNMEIKNNNNNSNNNIRKRNSAQRIPVSLLSKGEVLGYQDIDLENPISKRQYMAVVNSSSCKLLKLSKKQYLKCIE